MDIFNKDYVLTNSQPVVSVIIPAFNDEKYIEETTKRKEKLKLRCLQYGIDFVEIDVNQGFNNLLETYLIKRKKMM